MTSLPLALLTGAGAVLAWPAANPKHRLDILVPARHLPQVSALVWCVPGLVIALWSSPAVAIAVVLIARTVLSVHRWRAHRTHQDAVLTATACAADTLATQLRAGASAATALYAAGTDAGPPIGEALTTAATRAQLGGSAAAAIRASGIDELRGLAAAWALAEHYGLAPADMAEGVRADARGRQAFRSRANASLAGPRATMYILAGLPLLGLVMGHLLGADPLRFFTHGLGAVVLVVGVTLSCAGVLWALAILRGAEQPR
ncbi:type II secretion system F family protein [Corynebacterium sp. TAE3-ERU12]|uniref:type II secretion system F family protein n=1 Tax=Corynebacterium sp. TAE3-ERU12 TaxID=2849491 RepID=UPI001C4924B2|nr:type II secretion system F family protein [Corynebacterium sp. TAE3-ERU12]MBV7294489.1 type II secretion system F family protein [Corynebacterium sp. TAE3-ERU12]